MTRILHLSDTHVSASGTDMDGVDALGSLELMLRDAGRVPNIDVVVVTGDVADDGSHAGCVGVRDRVGAFCAERGVPHLYTTGNHDDRAAFGEALGSGHLDADGADRGRLMDPGSDLRAAVSEVDGLRIVTLDTLVPGQTHGVLDEQQLSWLADQLSTPAERGTLLAFHHPPLGVPSLPYAAEVVLQDTAALAEVVCGSDVRAVLCGHLHLQLYGSFAGVPVSVTAGVVTRIDTTVAPGLVRGVLGAGATVVDIGPGGPTFLPLVARDPRAGEQVYLYDAATGEDVDEDVDAGDVVPPALLELGDRRFAVARARREDVAELVELLREDGLGSARETADLATYLAEFEEVDRDPRHFVAVVRGESAAVVGTMQLTVLPGLSRRAATRLQIEGVRISAAARGAGLGTAMLEWAHAFGRGRGAVLAQLTSDKSRVDALRFYARLGYTASHEGLKRDL